MYIYIYMYTPSYIYTYLRTYVHAHTNMYAYIHTYTYTHIHTHTHEYAHARIAEEYVHLYSHITSIYPTPPHLHTCTPPLSRFLTVRNTCTPFSCKNM